MANKWGWKGNSGRFYFLGPQTHCGWWVKPWNYYVLPPWMKSYDKTRQHFKKQRYHFPSKCPYSQSYIFSSSHIHMWELNHKEGWVLKNWCFQIVVQEKTLESPLDCKEIKPINPKEKSTLNTHWKGCCWSWSSNTLATWCKEPICWKRLWFWKRLKTKEEQGAEDEMVWKYHWLNGHEFEQTPGDSEEQGSLLCCSPWGHEELNMT